MYAVVEGCVEIRINGQAVEHIERGSVFGEMSLIDHQPRSASAVAATKCKLAAIGEKRFLRLVEVTPQFALQMMRVISERRSLDSCSVNSLHAASPSPRYSAVCTRASKVL